MAANDLQEQLLTNKSPRSKHVTETKAFYADGVLWSLCIKIKYKTLSWPVNWCSQNETFGQKMTERLWKNSLWISTMRESPPHKRCKVPAQRSDARSSVAVPPCESTDIWRQPGLNIPFAKLISYTAPGSMSELCDSVIVPCALFGWPILSLPTRKCP